MQLQGWAIGGKPKDENSRRFIKWVGGRPRIVSWIASQRECPANRCVTQGRRAFSLE
jgi:hypothetical protein